MFCSNCAAPLTPPPGATNVHCGQCGHDTATDAPPALAPNPYAPITAAPASYGLGDGIPDAYQAAAAIAQEEPPLALDRIPPAPRQPSERARKLVFAYQGKQFVSLLIGLIFLAMGSVFSVVFAGGLPSDLLLAVFGETTPGTVIESHVQTNVKVNGRHPTSISFAYELGHQRYTGASSTLDWDVAKAAKPGAPIKVEMLTSLPDVCRVAGTTLSWTGYMGAFVFLFPLAGAASVFGAVRSNRREIRAFVHGKPVAARVLSRGLDRSVKVNGQSPTKITWQFEVNGASYTGDISHMNPSALGDLMRGHAVPVLYDPRNPKINTVYVS